MDGIDELHILILVHNAANSPEHLVHGLTQILPAMSREQDQTAASRPRKIFLSVVLCHRGAQSINGSIACDKNSFGILPLPKEILPCVLRRGKVILRQDTHRLTIKFLRIRRIQIIGPQPRLHMAHRNPHIKASQSGGESCGGIPVNQDNIRLLLFKHRRDLIQNRLRDIKEGLPLLHNGQVIIRLYPESPHHLLQHGFVLTSGAYHSGKLRPALEFIDQGAHFNSLRPSAEHQHDLFTHFDLPLFF